MSFFRDLIDYSNMAICSLKRNRRLSAWPGSPRLLLKLGSGMAAAKGWVNIDGSVNALVASWPGASHKILYRYSGANRYCSEAEYCRILRENYFLHHDLAYGIPFADKTADFIYSSHFLEHLFRREAAALLEESFRVLKPGGTLRLCVPDLEYALGLYKAGEKTKMLETYFFVDDRQGPLARHKYMYDFELLEAGLKAAGFTEVRRVKYREGTVPDLAALDNRPDETLYVEARK
jgi:SAM-dependent methyltransferase